MEDIEKQPIPITRFAPSPTGVLHVGGARTALFNFLFARKHGGTFLLRIEDTDTARSRPEFEDDILRGLSWLGIGYDNLYRQSQRRSIHRVYIQRLLDSGNAYVSEEEERGEGKQSTVIRFRNPKMEITFNDVIRGEVTFHTGELGDFVIAKDLDTPLFHLAVVVDDYEMGITHVIRGEDHISNTPRQILIQRALGIPTPTYAHIPLILGPDRSKLSKRHGALSVNEYAQEGYLPEAMVNFLALIGWNPGDEQEIFTLPELIEAFSLHRVQKGGAIFNTEKLDWINRQHLLRRDVEEVASSIEQYLGTATKSLPNYSRERLRKIVPIILDKIKKYGDVRDMEREGELRYFFQAPDYDTPQLICWKKDPDPSRTRTRLEQVSKILASLDRHRWSAELIKNALWEYAEAEGKGEVLWPLRFALSGKERSPDPFTLADVLGKDETIARVKNAITALRTIDGT